MIAVFSGNSNPEFLTSGVSGVRLFAFCSDRGRRIENMKNGTRVPA